MKRLYDEGWVRKVATALHISPDDCAVSFAHLAVDVTLTSLAAAQTV
jgi:hypothetical protein